jgi:hypothetical protein
VKFTITTLLAVAATATVVGCGSGGPAATWCTSIDPSRSIDLAANVIACDSAHAVVRITVNPDRSICDSGTLIRGVRTYCLEPLRQEVAAR